MFIVMDLLIPIFLLILLGFFFKKIKFPHQDFWTYLDKFNYFVLFPSLLVYKLSTANINSITSVDFILVSTIAILILSLLLIVYNKLFPTNGSSFTSIYQGSIRFNTYVFLALVDAIFGDYGIVVGALLITFMIPLLNLLSISSFVIYVSDVKITIKSFGKSIFTNPLILACLFGGGINFIGLSLPLVIENTLSILTLASLPLGLLSVGVGLNLSNLVNAKAELIVASIAKLILLPILMLSIGYMFNLEPLYLSIIVLFSSIPTATSAYILAKELGGDIKLMSSIISLQTILSIISISIFIQFIYIP